jgi:gluconate 2-dehydrogenase gamma chain
MSEQSERLQGIVAELTAPEETPHATSTRDTLAAAMDAMLPPVDGIGASSAEAIRFIDVTTERGVFAGQRAMLTQAAAWLEQTALDQFGTSFVDCTRAERHRVLEQAQGQQRKEAWRHFAVLLRSALAGFLCDPSWGGNADRHGWIHIGKEAPPARPDEADSRSVPPLRSTS